MGIRRFLSVAGLSTRDPWLCEPASRRGCLCRWLREAAIDLNRQQRGALESTAMDHRTVGASAVSSGCAVDANVASPVAARKEARAGPGLRLPPWTSRTGPPRDRPRRRSRIRGKEQPAPRCSSPCDSALRLQRGARSQTLLLSPGDEHAVGRGRDDRSGRAPSVRVGPRLALARCAKRHSAGTLGFTRVSTLPECRNHAEAQAGPTRPRLLNRMEGESRRVAAAPARM
jgi:hypothetical protein